MSSTTFGLRTFTTTSVPLVQRGGMDLPDRCTRERHGLKCGERLIGRRMKLALDDVLDHLARDRRRRVLQLAQLGPVIG